jgi:hypothetical protein
VDAAMRTTLPDENALCGKGPRYLTDDGSSVSIADMPRQKRVLALSIPKREAHSRPKEIGLFSAMLGRISILTWSQLMIKTPIAIAARTAVGLSSAQPAKPDSDFYTLNG